jgi:Ni/Co efflux regulator RcnB
MSSWLSNGLSVTAIILGLAVIVLLIQLYMTNVRLNEKLSQVEQAATENNESIGEATLAAAQQAAWDAAWARRLASRPVYVRPLFRPRYHHWRRHHRAPKHHSPAPVDDEPVVEEEVVA